MVAEAIADTEVELPAAPPPESPNATPSEEGRAVPETGAEGEEGEETPKPPAQTPADVLASAHDVVAKIRAGDESVSLTAAQLKALNTEQAQESQQAEIQRQAKKQYDDLITELEGAHDAAPAAILSAFNELLEEDGHEFTPSQLKVLETAVRDVVGGLKSKAAQIVVEPLRAIEADRLAQTLVASGLETPARAQALVARLPLVGATPADDSISKRLYFAGLAAGQRMGGGPDTVTLPKADFEKQLAAARSAGADSVKAGGGKAAPGAGARNPHSDLSFAQIQKLSPDEIQNLPDGVLEKAFESASNGGK